MDKILEVPVFLDFYSALLTERQADILTLYSDEDYSLAEIAEQFQISRQAVHDSVKSGIAALEEFEDKMGLVKKYKKRRDLAEDMARTLAGLNFDVITGDDREKINRVLEKLAELSEI